jgi:tetratricopeptide (TPR) repeat protein
MKHCDDIQSAVLQYSDGLLDDRKKKDLEEHLVCCPNCRAEYEQAQRQLDFLRKPSQMGFMPSESELSAFIDQGFLRTQTSKVQIIRFKANTLMTRLAAAAVLFIVLVAGYCMNDYFRDHVNRLLGLSRVNHAMRSAPRDAISSAKALASPVSPVAIPVPPPMAAPPYNAEAVHALITAGRFSEAICKINDHLKLTGDSVANTYYDLAYSLSRVENYSEALVNYEKSLRLANDTALIQSARHRRNELLVSRFKDYALAEPEVRAFIKAYPNGAWTEKETYYLIQMVLSKPDPQEAKSLMRQYLSDYPTSCRAEIIRRWMSKIASSE